MVEKTLNLKNPETYRLASELAKRTGESMTEAVTVALRERLARTRGGRKGSLAEELLEIGRDCASRLSDRVKKLDHAELLYDERGLPK